MSPNQSAIMKTGSMQSIFTKETVDKHRSNRDNTVPIMAIEFGQGLVVSSQELAIVGCLKTIVLKELKDNLFSPDQFIDAGAVLFINSKGGLIFNPHNDSVIPIFRDQDTWKVWIADVQQFEPEDAEDSDDKEVLAKHSRLASIHRTVSNDQLISKYINLHERMGHPSARYMVKAMHPERPTWNNCSLTRQQIREASKLWKCPDCILSKRRRVTIPENEPSDSYDEYLRSLNAEPGEILSFDPVGPITPYSSGTGHRYVLLFKDVATGMNHAYTSAGKSAQEILDALEATVTWYRKNGKIVRILRTDNENVNMSELLKAYLNLPEISIKLQSSIPYSHWQNAVERDVQSIVNGTSVLMGADKKYSLATFKRLSR